jgi:ATP-dependent DNA helicase RecQ
VPVLATTATANDRVAADVQEQVGRLGILRGPLARDSLLLQTIRLAKRFDISTRQLNLAAGATDYTADPL